MKNEIKQEESIQLKSIENESRATKEAKKTNENQIKTFDNKKLIVYPKFVCFRNDFLETLL